MKCIKNIIELKQNITNKFDKWFAENPENIPTFKVIYECLGISNLFIKNLNKYLNSYDMDLDKINNSLKIDYNKTSYYSIFRSLDKTELQSIYNLIYDCIDKFKEEYWYRSINSKNKYMNPRLLELYANRYFNEDAKKESGISVNIKIDKTEVSINK